MNKIACAGIGGVIGAAIGLLFGKIRYQKIANKEIESVKRTYSELSAPKEEEKPVAVPVKEEKKSGIPELEELARKYNPTAIPKDDKRDAIERSSINSVKPEIISQLECGRGEYEPSEMTYFRDGTVLGSDGKPLSDQDVDDILGIDNLRTISGRDFDDPSKSVCIRNDRLEMDIELVLDPRNYSDLRHS